MCRRLALIMEILTIFLIMYSVYGQKWKFGSPEILVIIEDMIIFELINAYNVDKIIIILLYFGVFIYSMSRFGRNIKKLLLGNTIYILLLGTLQMGVGLLLLSSRLSFRQDISVLCVNFIVLVIVFLIRGLLGFCFEILEEKSYLMGGVLILTLLYMIGNIIRYKVEMSFSVVQMVFVTVLCGLILIISYCWQDEREKAYERKRQLEMTQLYGDSFKKLIEELREKQHDHYNHIQAILSLHYTVHTYEELVKEQQDYCIGQVESNKFSDLLRIDSPILIGFLYGKFIEADKRGVEVKYAVDLKKKSTMLPIQLVIEMVGILWDNAMEAEAEIEQKRHIEIRLENNSNCFNISVANAVNNISYEQIQHFFEQGYTEKRGHSGIGLVKIKKLATKFKLDLIVRKETRGGQDWLVIGMKKIKKEALHKA